MIAATSASRASAARSTAIRAADASVVHGETLATKSASCWVDHAQLAISAGRQFGIIGNGGDSGGGRGPRLFPGTRAGPDPEPAMSWHAPPQQRWCSTTLLA